VTVQLQDQFSNPVNATGPGQTVRSEERRVGKECSNPADTLTVNTITIPSGSSTASFLYKDTVAGSPTIAADDQAPPTGTDTGLTRATQTETVNAANASKFVFTTSPQTLSARLNSRTVTVQLQDQFSNPVNATGPGQTV